MLEDRIKEVQAAIVAEDAAYTEYQNLSLAARAAQKAHSVAEHRLQEAQMALRDELYAGVGLQTPQQKYMQEAKAS